MLLYNYIKKLCEDRNLTVQQLADLAGVSYSTMRQWKRGRPLPGTLMKVADTLHVPFEKFLSYLPEDSCVCAICGNPIRPSKEHPARVKYCSDECANIAKNARPYSPPPVTKRPKKKHKCQIPKTEAEARKLGMSYGQYVALRDGMYRPTINHTQK